jgi:hypothetical protein
MRDSPRQSLELAEMQGPLLAQGSVLRYRLYINFDLTICPASPRRSLELAEPCASKRFPTFAR